MKKLLLAAVSIAVFTLHGLDQVQLVAVIAFLAGVYAPRFPDRRESRTSFFGIYCSLADLKRHSESY